MGPDDGADAAVDAEKRQQDLKAKEERELGHQERQVYQHERAARRDATAGLVLQASHCQDGGHGRGGSGDDGGNPGRLRRSLEMGEPVIKGPNLRQRGREAPHFGKRPDRKRKQAGKHHESAQTDRHKGKPSHGPVTTVSPARFQARSADQRCQPLQAIPGENRGCDEAKLQQRTGSGRKAHVQIGIRGPAQNQNG